jgi:hypothetical protein
MTPRRHPKMLGATLVVAVLALTGCTPTATSLPTTASLPSLVDSTTTVTVEVSPITVKTGTVVATGALTSVDGRTTGSVSVIAASVGRFDVKIDGFTSPYAGEAVLNFSAHPFDEQRYCDNGFVIYQLGVVTLAPSMLADMSFDGTLSRGNPDFIDTVLLTSNDPAAERTGCFYPVMATAELEWTMPDLRPDISVADSGAAGGAGGTATTIDGEITAYTVAPGDVLAEVAKRFGISVTDLFYLNPSRAPNPQDPIAYTGEVLNLDKSAR